MNVREDNVAKFLDGLFSESAMARSRRCSWPDRQLRMAANCIEDGAGSRIRSRGGGHRPIIAPVRLAQPNCVRTTRFASPNPA